MVRGIRTVELLALIGMVEVVIVMRVLREGKWWRPEAVDIPRVALPEQFPAVECTACVRPVERRDQSLVAVQQLLAADACRQRATATITPQLSLAEQVDEVGPVLFVGARR